MEQVHRDKGLEREEVWVLAKAAVLVRVVVPAQARVGSVPAPNVVKRGRIKWGCHALSRSIPSVALP